MYKNRIQFERPIRSCLNITGDTGKAVYICLPCPVWMFELFRVGAQEYRTGGWAWTHRLNQILKWKLHVVYPACITCGFSFICPSSPLYNNNLHFGVFPFFFFFFILNTLIIKVFLHWAEHSYLNTVRLVSRLTELYTSCVWSCCFEVCPLGLCRKYIHQIIMSLIFIFILF